MDSEQPYWKNCGRAANKGKPGTIESINMEKLLLLMELYDAIFIEKNPIEGLDQFTVEVIFQPASGWNFEQRYLTYW